MKPLTLPHTPLRLLKHRTKNTYEPPKERTTKRTNRRTNHEKNDQKHEQKNEPKSTNHEKNDRKNEPRRTNHEKNDRKARAKKHKPSPNVSSPPHSPGVCKPASQSHKAQQAPLIASLRPRTQSSPYRSHVS